MTNPDQPLAADITQSLEKADLLETFIRLAPSHRKEYIKWIDEAKKPETRQRRIEKMLEMVAAGRKS